MSRECPSPTGWYSRWREHLGESLNHTHFALVSNLECNNRLLKRKQILKDIEQALCTWISLKDDYNTNLQPSCNYITSNSILYNSKAWDYMYSTPYFYGKEPIIHNSSTFGIPYQSVSYDPYYSSNHSIVHTNSVITNSQTDYFNKDEFSVYPTNSYYLSNYNPDNDLSSNKIEKINSQCIKKTINKKDLKQNINSTNYEDSYILDNTIRTDNKLISQISSDTYSHSTNIYQQIYNASKNDNNVLNKSLNKSDKMSWNTPMTMHNYITSSDLINCNNISYDNGYIENKQEQKKIINNYLKDKTYFSSNNEDTNIPYNNTSISPKNKTQAYQTTNDLQQTEQNAFKSSCYSNYGMDYIPSLYMSNSVISSNLANDGLGQIYNNESRINPKYDYYKNPNKLSYINNCFWDNSQSVTNFNNKYINNNQPLPNKNKLLSALQYPKVAKLFAFGSYRLGLTFHGSDIDAVAVCPASVTRNEFNNIFLSRYLAQAIPGVTEVNIITSAFTPITKVTIQGIQIDILFSRLVNIAQKVPQSVPELLHHNMRHAFDSEVSLRSIGGVVVIEEIIQRVTRPDNFLLTALVLKSWAKRRHINNSSVGLLGGIVWIIIAARVSQQFPFASPDRLVLESFKFLATCNWDNELALISKTDSKKIMEIMLTSIKDNPIQNAKSLEKNDLFIIEKKNNKPQIYKKLMKKIQNNNLRENKQCYSISKPAHSKNKSKKAMISNNIVFSQTEIKNHFKINEPNNLYKKYLISNLSRNCFSCGCKDISMETLFSENEKRNEVSTRYRNLMIRLNNISNIDITLDKFIFNIMKYIKKSNENGSIRKLEDELTLNLLKCDHQQNNKFFSNLSDKKINICSSKYLDYNKFRQKIRSQVNYDYEKFKTLYTNCPNLFIRPRYYNSKKTKYFDSIDFLLTVFTTHIISIAKYILIINKNYNTSQYRNSYIDQRLYTLLSSLNKSSKQDLYLQYISLGETFICELLLKIIQQRNIPKYLKLSCINIIQFLIKNCYINHFDSFLNSNEEQIIKESLINKKISNSSINGTKQISIHNTNFEDYNIEAVKSLNLCLYNKSYNINSSCHTFNKAKSYYDKNYLNISLLDLLNSNTPNFLACHSKKNDILYYLRSLNNSIIVSRKINTKTLSLNKKKYEQYYLKSIKRLNYLGYLKLSKRLVSFTNFGYQLVSTNFLYKIIDGVYDVNQNISQNYFELTSDKISVKKKINSYNMFETNRSCIIDSPNIFKQNTSVNKNQKYQTTNYNNLDLFNTVGQTSTLVDQKNSIWSKKVNINVDTDQNSTKHNYKFHNDNYINSLNSINKLHAELLSYNNTIPFDSINYLFELSKKFAILCTYEDINMFNDDRSQENQSTYKNLLPELSSKQYYLLLSEINNDPINTPSTKEEILNIIARNTKPKDFGVDYAVLTPTQPTLNAVHIIRPPAFAYIQGEASRAWNIFQNINSNNFFDSAKEVLKEKKFHNEFKNYLQIELSSNNKNELSRWHTFVKSKLRFLNQLITDFTEFETTNKIENKTVKDEIKNSNFKTFIYDGPEFITIHPYEDNSNNIDKSWIKNEIEFINKISTIFSNNITEPNSEMRNTVNHPEYVKNEPKLNITNSKYQEKSNYSNISNVSSVNSEDENSIKYSLPDEELSQDLLNSADNSSYSADNSSYSADNNITDIKYISCESFSTKSNTITKENIISHNDKINKKEHNLNYLNYSPQKSLKTSSFSHLKNKIENVNNFEESSKHGFASELDVSSFIGESCLLSNSRSLTTNKWFHNKDQNSTNMETRKENLEPLSIKYRCSNKFLQKTKNNTPYINKSTNIAEYSSDLKMNKLMSDICCDKYTAFVLSENNAKNKSSFSNKFAFQYEFKDHNSNYLDKKRIIYNSKLNTYSSTEHTRSGSTESTVISFNRDGLPIDSYNKLILSDYKINTLVSEKNNKSYFIKTNKLQPKQTKMSSTIDSCENYLSCEYFRKCNIIDSRNKKIYYNKSCSCRYNNPYCKLRNRHNSSSTVDTRLNSLSNLQIVKNSMNKSLFSYQKIKNMSVKEKSSYSQDYSNQGPRLNNEFNSLNENYFVKINRTAVYSCHPRIQNIIDRSDKMHYSGVLRKNKNDYYAKDYFCSYQPIPNMSTKRISSIRKTQKFLLKSIYEPKGVTINSKHDLNINKKNKVLSSSTNLDISKSKNYLQYINSQYNQRSFEKLDICDNSSAEKYNLNHRTLNKYKPSLNMPKKEIQYEKNPSGLNDSESIMKSLDPQLIEYQIISPTKVENLNTITCYKELRNFSKSQLKTDNICNNENTSSSGKTYYHSQCTVSDSIDYLSQYINCTHEESNCNSDSSKSLDSNFNEISSKVKNYSAEPIFNNCHVALFPYAPDNIELNILEKILISFSDPVKGNKIYECTDNMKEFENLFIDTVLDPANHTSKYMKRFLKKKAKRYDKLLADYHSLSSRMNDFNIRPSNITYPFIEEKFCIVRNHLTNTSILGKSNNLNQFISSRRDMISIKSTEYSEIVFTMLLFIKSSLNKIYNSSTLNSINDNPFLNLPNVLDSLYKLSNVSDSDITKSLFELIYNNLYMKYNDQDIRKILNYVLYNIKTKNVAQCYNMRYHSKKSNNLNIRQIHNIIIILEIMKFLTYLKNTNLIKLNSSENEKEGNQSFSLLLSDIKKISKKEKYMHQNKSDNPKNHGSEIINQKPSILENSPKVLKDIKLINKNNSIPIFQEVLSHKKQSRLCKYDSNVTSACKEIFPIDRNWSKEILKESYIQIPSKYNLNSTSMKNTINTKMNKLNKYSYDRNVNVCSLDQKNKKSNIDQVKKYRNMSTYTTNITPNYSRNLDSINNNDSYNFWDIVQNRVQYRFKKPINIHNRDNKSLISNKWYYNNNTENYDLYEINKEGKYISDKNLDYCSTTKSRETGLANSKLFFKVSYSLPKLNHSNTLNYIIHPRPFSLVQKTRIRSIAAIRNTKKNYNDIKLNKQTVINSYNQFFLKSKGSIDKEIYNFSKEIENTSDCHSSNYQKGGFYKESMTRKANINSSLVTKKSSFVKQKKSISNFSKGSVAKLETYKKIDDYNRFKHCTNLNPKFIEDNKTFDAKNLTNYRDILISRHSSLVVQTSVKNIITEKNKVFDSEIFFRDVSNFFHTTRYNNKRLLNLNIQRRHSLSISKLQNTNNHIKSDIMRNERNYDLAKQFDLKNNQKSIYIQNMCDQEVIKKFKNHVSLCNKSYPKKELSTDMLCKRDSKNPHTSNSSSQSKSIHIHKDCPSKKYNEKNNVHNKYLTNEIRISNGENITSNNKLYQSLSRTGTPSIYNKEYIKDIKVNHSITPQNSTEKSFNNQNSLEFLKEKHNINCNRNIKQLDSYLNKNIISLYESQLKSLVNNNFTDNNVLKQYNSTKVNDLSNCLEKNIKLTTDSPSISMDNKNNHYIINDILHLENYIDIIHFRKLRDAILIYTGYKEYSESWESLDDFNSVSNEFAYTQDYYKLVEKIMIVFNQLLAQNKYEVLYLGIKSNKQCEIKTRAALQEFCSYIERYDMQYPDSVIKATFKIIQSTN